MASRRRSARGATTRIRTPALLIRNTPFGESDAMVSLFTEQRGVVTAVARSARRPGRRFSALEPMHLLLVTLDETEDSGVAKLAESAILCPRLRLVGSLDALEAAGRVLRWVRRSARQNAVELGVWSVANLALDALDALDPQAAAGRKHPDAIVVGAGLQILTALGLGLELGRCVRCGRECPAHASACFSAELGGIVCRACGGAASVISANLRERLAAVAAGETLELNSADAETAIAMVEAAFVAHA